MTSLENALYKYIIARHDDHDHDHDHDHEDEDTGSVTTAKAVAMCVLFSLSFLMGCLPIQLAKWLKWDQSTTKNNKMVNFLLCIGGGVLMCTTFLHLLPEVNEQLTELQEDSLFPELQFHFAELLMCLGFLIMYFVEECVHVYLENREQKNFNTLRRTLSVRRGEKEETKNDNDTNDVESSCYRQHSHPHSHVDHSHVIFEDTVVKGIRGFLIVFALSVHELFEGFAVGLESSASSVWYMFGAVSAHKLVIAFCIGVELVTTGTKKLLCILYVFTFAVVSPIGIGLGIILTGGSGAATDIASVILQGLASGTLLYVVFFEILQGDRKHGLRQWSAVVVGFAIMFVITVFRIGIGIILSHTGNNEENVIAVVLQAMAAGTLLYVVFFEVLAREKSNIHSGVWQLLAIVSGFMVMCILQASTGHSHSHSHDHGTEEEVVEATTVQ